MAQCNRATESCRYLHTVISPTSEARRRSDSKHSNAQHQDNRRHRQEWLGSDRIVALQVSCSSSAAVGSEEGEQVAAAVHGHWLGVSCDGVG